ncbi:MAG TPA: TIGR03618 family F420-dependent PPOX class oxidoreductase [Dehalococcoidia bacterium]|jgi:PPOX class probable F420-dependent enzyme|nr:TIGR03618 family F420-dependent PPOX class oxidoreductase [Dehalococcoidia bacterium]
MATLSPDQRKIFQDQNFVAVATVGRDGTPRNTIVWVDVDGDDVLVNGAESRAWIKNLKHNPNVALTIFDHEQPYRRVSVIGKAVQITTDGAEDHIDKLSMKYGGRPYPNHLPNDPRVLVRIRPSKITAMGVR